jgi:hypothetical protein
MRAPSGLGVSRWWDRRRCGARAAMTSRVRVGVMTVRSASQPSGPSFVVGVSSVHGVNSWLRCRGRRRPGSRPQSPMPRRAGGVVGWAHAPAWPAGRGAVCGDDGEVGDPWREGRRLRVVRRGAGGAWSGAVGRPGMPRAWPAARAQDALAREGRVDPRLGRQDGRRGGLRGEGGEVVLALLDRSLAERVPAHRGGADAAQVGVALVAERPPTRRAFGDQDEAVVGAGGDEEQPPGGLPGAGLGEARGADLGAVGGVQPRAATCR